MSLLDHAKATIPAPDYQVKVMHDDGNTSDIIDTILYADSKVSNYMCAFAAAFERNYSGLYEIWDFTHRYIKYIADEPGEELVKDPRVTWADRSGDCKSFSLFIGSILKCLGIPYRYRFASYQGADPTHVYIIAKINRRDVIMDATIEKFDYEVAYKKKWDKMTQIKYLHGAGPAILGHAKPTPAERIADAPKIGTPKSFIDYSNLTEGQLTLRLLDEQIKILSNYYGDPIGNYQKARNIIYLNSKNLHSISGISGPVDTQFYNLLHYIEYAKERSKPAGIASARIGDFASDRESLIKDCNYTKSEYSKWQAGGKINPLTKQRTPEYSPKKKDGSSWDLNDLNKAKLACDDQVFFLDLFNQHLEGSAPHVLYEFIPDSELNTLPGTANFKANNHRLANSSMARYSQLDRLNLVLWERNGIMRTAASKGLKNISPEAFIAEWKKGKNNVTGAHIGIAFAALLPIIAAAVGVASKLLTLIQQQKAAFASEVKGYGSPQFGPGELDFLNDDSSSGFNDILPFAAAGAAALLLINGK